MSLLAVIVIFVGMGAALIAGATQKRFIGLQGVTRGLLVTYVTTMLILTGGELYFRYVYADSGWAFTLAGQNWHNWYVDNNSDGYRDREWTAADLDGKRTVLVIGDSFTQGFGIENPEDRYANVLASRLGPEYAVINLGVIDTATRDQITTLAGYPVQNPEVVIWQYYVNDINAAALSIGQYWLPRLPRRRPQFVDESYLANFIYWRLAPFFTTVDVTDYADYWSWAYAAYDNATIWDIHAAELRAMIDQVEAMGARLIVVLFPNMEDPLATIPYVDRVAQLLESEGVTDVMRLHHDVAYFATHETESVVVSARDFHASAAFNRYLGQRMYDLYFALGD